MKEANSNDNYDAQTLLLNDSNGNELFCYLEQLVSVEGQEYALLTPVDTPGRFNACLAFCFLGNPEFGRTFHF